MVDTGFSTFTVTVCFFPEPSSAETVIFAVPALCVSTKPSSVTETTLGLLLLYRRHPALSRYLPLASIGSATRRAQSFRLEYSPGCTLYRVRPVRFPARS